MLLLLIPVAWVVIITLVIAVCQAAARGEGMPAQLVENSGSAECPDKLGPPAARAWDAAPALIGLGRRGRRPALQDSTRVRSRRLAHGARQL